MRKNKDYMSTILYFWRCLYYAAWFSFIYYVFLFINIPDMTMVVSKVIYFGVNQVIWFVLFLLTPEKGRSESSALFNVVLGYVPYFLITYFEGYRTLVSFFVITAIVVSVIFCLMIFCRKIENKKKIEKVRKNRLNFAIHGVRNIAGAVMLTLISLLVVCSAFEINLKKSDVPTLQSSTAPDAEQWTVANNIETVALLQDEEWERLSEKERLNVLATIANIECRYLGFPGEIVVTSEVMSDETLGRYNHKEKTIEMNSVYLMEYSASGTLRTFLHEVWHASEHYQVEALESVDDKYKNLHIFKAAREYQSQIENYIVPEDDAWGYMTQSMELDADKYAELAVKDYYDRIAEYLQEPQVSTSA